MSQVQALAAVGGLAAGLLALGGLLWWQSGLDASAAAAAADSWRPPCAARLGKAYAALEPSVEADDAAPRNLLFGVDRSGSNQELADRQLDAVVGHVATLPAEVGVGVLLITDRSERSTTPDMPFEPGEPGRRFRPAALPCAPDCRADSLFQQKCLEQIGVAQDRRVDELEQAEAARRTTLQEQRALRVHAWHESVAGFTPRPGTSLLGFFAKLADLPPVRREPERTTVVVLSDLEESRTPERRQIDQFYRKYRSTGTCPEAQWLPRGISGVEIALVQSVRDGIDADAWASKWEAVLTCAGAQVRRHRYTSAVPLAQLLDEPPVVLARQ